MKVCVTGASGYIASWLVKLLLQRGYTVNATVRDPSDPTKTEHLVGLEGAKERLHLFKADLMEEGSFDSAVTGCEGVFHVASPVIFDVKDPQMWYVLSKTLAEDAAWKYVKENGIDMVSIVPGMVIGPMLQPTLNDSVASILNLINGSETYPDLACPWVHIEDVAEVHIRAFELPTAKGRFCIAESVVHMSEVLKILHELYPSLQLPNKCVDIGPVTKSHFQISKAKAKSLGIEFIPFKAALKNTVESLKEKKFVSF